MKEPNNKWPFSIILGQKRFKLKDRCKNILENKNGIYIGIIALFFLLGSFLAFYQYYYIGVDKGLEFQRTVSNEGGANLRISKGAEEYKLNTVEITIPKRIEEKEEGSAVKVNSKVLDHKGFGNIIRPIDGEIILSWQEPYKDKVLDAWKFNSGVDFKVNIGSEVKVVADGVVEEIINDDYKGNTIIIKHNNLFKSLYSNVENRTLNKGEEVNQGEMIGKVGDYGENEKSKFHFEIIKIENGEDVRVSPLEYFN